MENNIYIACTLMILMFLGVSTYFDFRWRRIPVWVLGMGVIFLCVSMIVQGEKPGLAYLISLIPGAFMIMLSFITKENIGYADGISVLILGGMAGIRNCIWVMCISLMMISLVGLCLIALKRANRKTRIPYVPFVFAAQALLLIGTKL